MSPEYVRSSKRREMGIQPAEVGNLVALASGLAPAQGGSVTAEIERLPFQRDLVEAQRPGS